MKPWTPEDKLLYIVRAAYWMMTGVAATFLALALAGVPLPPCDPATGSAQSKPASPPARAVRAPVAIESANNPVWFAATEAFWDRNKADEG